MEGKQKQRTLFLLCLSYGVWHTASQWTTTLVSFLHWDARPPLDVLQISYVQAAGSVCNALGALMLGQVSRRHVMVTIV